MDRSVARKRSEYSVRAGLLGGFALQRILCGGFGVPVSGPATESAQQNIRDRRDASSDPCKQLCTPSSLREERDSLVEKVAQIEDLRPEDQWQRVLSAGIISRRLGLLSTGLRAPLTARPMTRIFILTQAWRRQDATADPRRDSALQAPTAQEPSTDQNCWPS